MAFKIKNKVYDIHGNTYDTDVYVVFSSKEVNTSNVDNFTVSINLRFYKDIHSYNNNLSPITPIKSFTNIQKINTVKKNLTSSESFLLNQQMVYTYVYDYLVSEYGKDYVVDCMGLLTSKESLTIPLMSGVTLSGYTTYCGIDSILSDGAEIGENTFSNSYECNKNIKWLGSYNGSNDGGSSFKINVSKSGNYDIVVCYASCFNDGDHTMKITVNDVDYTQLVSNNTDWSTQSNFTITVLLNLGDNIITFHGNNDGTQAPDFIYFQVPSKPKK